MFSPEPDVCVMSEVDLAALVCRCLQINFVSYTQMATAALPTLEKSNGAVVVVSSLLGKETRGTASASASASASALL